MKRASVALILVLLSSHTRANDDCLWKGIWVANDGARNKLELDVCRGAWGTLTFQWAENWDAVPSVEKLRATIVGDEVRAFRGKHMTVSFPFRPEKFGTGWQVEAFYMGTNDMGRMVPWGHVKLRKGVPAPQPRVYVVGDE